MHEKGVKKMKRIKFVIATLLAACLMFTSMIAASAGEIIKMNTDDYTFPPKSKKALIHGMCRFISTISISRCMRC